MYHLIWEWSQTQLGVLKKGGSNAAFLVPDFSLTKQPEATLTCAKYGCQRIDFIVLSEETF
jgi:hypothetical protein